MKRSTRRYVVVVLVLLLASAAAVASGSNERTLVVESADSGDRLLEIPVEEGDEVTLSYTHSVEKTPVRDVYVVEDAELREERMVFHSHGAGLPSDEPIERTDEGFVVAGEDSYEDLIVSPGSIAGHELVVGNERYDLVAQSEGTVVIYVDGTFTDRLPDALDIGSSTVETVSDARLGTLLV